jgi:hypothetical protein
MVPSPRDSHGKTAALEERQESLLVPSEERKIRKASHCPMV